MTVFITEGLIWKAIVEALGKCTLGGRQIDKQNLSPMKDLNTVMYGDRVTSELLSVRKISTNLVDPTYAANVTLSSNKFTVDELLTLAEEIEKILGSKIKIILE